ncbi:MAG: hypothetical protein IT323_02885 [Anaerolineae bacterium]|nr:hypothetical protein [Anaerolineae bacterium]
MIDVKQAVKIARDYVTGLYGDEAENLMLEETEMSEDGRYWLITVGFDTKQPAEVNPLVPMADRRLILPRYLRAYKLVRLNAENGAVEAMKNREL